MCQLENIIVDYKMQKGKLLDTNKASFEEVRAVFHEVVSTKLDYKTNMKTLQKIFDYMNVKKRERFSVLEK